MTKKTKVAEVKGANFSKEWCYPIVDLTVERTGREGCHAYQVSALAIARNSVRNVNVYLSLDQLRTFARDILRATAMEANDVE